MVTANRFWSQIVGVASANKRRLHFFLLFVPLAGMWTSSIGIMSIIDYITILIIITAIIIIIIMYMYTYIYIYKQ